MKLRGPADVGEPDVIPQYVVAAIATLVLLCLIASVQARNGRAVERVRLPKEAIARLPPTVERRELLLSVAFPSSTNQPRDQVIPVVEIDNHTIPLDQVPSELERMRQRFEREQPQQGLSDVAVLIRAEPEIPTGVIQQLVKNCQDAGFERFSLKSEDEEDAP